MIPLAHAGGWDEILALLLPAAVFWVVLNVRRNHLAAKDEAEHEPTEEPSGR